MRSFRFPRSAATVAVLVSLIAGQLILLSAPAGASGSATIAGAVPVTFGTEYFGNTASDPTYQWSNPPCCNLPIGTEFWLVPAIAGDTISVTGSETAPASGFNVALLNPGTTDVTLPLLTGNEWSGAPLDSGLTDIVSTTGTYVLAVGAGSGENPGPFHFVVNVQHAGVLYAPRVARTGLAGHLTVFLRAPDGTPITAPNLVIVLHGYWKKVRYAPATGHVLGLGHPANGQATIAFRIPRPLAGSTIELVVSASGPTFGPIKNVV